MTDVGVERAQAPGFSRGDTSASKPQERARPRALASEEAAALFREVVSMYDGVNTADASGLWDGPQLIENFSWQREVAAMRDAYEDAAQLLSEHADLEGGRGNLAGALCLELAAVGIRNRARGMGLCG